MSSYFDSIGTNPAKTNAIVSNSKINSCHVINLLNLKFFIQNTEQSIPITNAIIAHTFVIASPALPLARLTPVITILPVCAFAKVPPLSINVYASKKPPVNVSSNATSIESSFLPSITQHPL